MACCCSAMAWSPPACARVRACMCVRVRVRVRVCVHVHVCACEAGTSGLESRFFGNRDFGNRDCQESPYVESSDDTPSGKSLSLASKVRRRMRSISCNQWGCIVRCVCESPRASLFGCGCEGVSVTVRLVFCLPVHAREGVCRPGGVFDGTRAPLRARARACVHGAGTHSESGGRRARECATACGCECVCEPG
jgi:hypothetical protein